MDPSDIITSRDNAKLKLARSVRDGRDAELIFVEGVRLVEEAIRSGTEIVHAFVSADINLAGRVPGLPEHVLVEPKIFHSISDTENSQGIVVLIRRLSSSLDHLAGRLAVLLHHVNNPSNLGAVVRTAEAAGVVGLITTTGSADAFSPKALRASMGSAFRLPIVERIDFDDAIVWSRERGLVSTAADISGEVSYAD